MTFLGLNNLKGRQMPRSTIVGYIDSYGKEHCWNWAQSIKASGYSGNVVIIATRISQETKEWLNSLGFTVYLHNPHPKIVPVVIRFLYLSQLIRQGKINTEWVMLSDVKDVVFQRNLDEFYEGRDCEIGVFSEENVLYKDEPWGAQNMQMSFPYSWENMKDVPIVNAGTFSADLNSMANICETVFYMSLGSPVHNPDQAALNIVVRAFHSDMNFGIDTEYAIQIGTTFDSTKQLIQIRDLSSVTWNEDGVVSYNHMPYYIVHQYDRNPELKRLINNRYGNGR
jgi:hypothetical protein